MKVRQTQVSDATHIQALYKAVASKPGGIARLEHEITDAYIQQSILTCIDSDSINPHMRKTPR